jgi:hypothetical protein
MFSMVQKSLLYFCIFTFCACKQQYELDTRPLSFEKDSLDEEDFIEEEGVFGDNIFILERVSVKLIFGKNDESPYNEKGAIKNINSIINFFNVANKILMENGSEIRIGLMEIIELKENNYPGISNFYNLSWTCTKETKDCGSVVLSEKENEQNWNYFISIAKTGKFGWRNTMVNVYINGYFFGTGGGCDDLMQLFLGHRTDSGVLLHELGHGLSLRHTHEEDLCDDTLIDNSEWSNLEIALHNPGATTQQIRETAYNVMSYHNGEKAIYFTECQLNRMSDFIKKSGSDVFDLILLDDQKNSEMQ